TNVAPTGTFSTTPSPAYEGVKLSVSIQSVVDPGTADVIQYAFDCGDGKGYSALGTINSRACNPADNGTLTAKGKVQDDDGGVSAYSAVVSIANVAPSFLTASSQQGSSLTHSVSVNVSFTDPGVDAPWTLKIDWGDFKQDAFPANPNQGYTVAHSYAKGGKYP